MGSGRSAGIRSGTTRESRSNEVGYSNLTIIGAIVVIIVVLKRPGLPEPALRTGRS